jgi:hypothetical protein
MPAKVFRKAKFNRRSQLPCRFAAILVHVPATLDKPIFKTIQRKIATQITTEFFTNFGFSNQCFTASRFGAALSYMKRIETTEMQKMFNDDGAFWQRVKDGELTAVTLEDRHPSLTVANEPLLHSKPNGLISRCIEE